MDELERQIIEVESSAGRGAASEVTGTGRLASPFRPGPGLDKGLTSSCWNDESKMVLKSAMHLERTWEHYDVLGWVSLQVTLTHVSTTEPNCVAIYKDAMEAKLKLPLPPFMRELCRAY